jgi:hypothetical protein
MRTIIITGHPGGNRLRQANPFGRLEDLPIQGARSAILVSVNSRPEGPTFATTLDQSAALVVSAPAQLSGNVAWVARQGGRQGEEFVGQRAQLTPASSIRRVEV